MSFPLALALVPLLVAPAVARAQAMSCTAVYGDRSVTLELSRRGQEASRALLSRLEPAVVAAMDALERGLLAEMEGHPQPAAFREALQKLQEVEAAARILDERLDALQATHRQDRPLAAFDDALKKILRDRPLGPSRGLRGAVRHARAGAGEVSAKASEEPASLDDIFRMQRADLQEVRRAFAELAEDVRQALPLAGGKGLAAAALAGRIPLLSAIQAALERWEAQRAFSVESCRATQAAAAQVYPTGMEWLEEQEPPRRDSR